MFEVIVIILAQTPEIEQGLGRFLSCGARKQNIQKFQDFIKKTKNWFSFANILLVAFEYALNTTICTIKKIIELLF